MSVTSWLWAWVRGTIYQRRVHEEVEAELQFHINAYADDLIARGIPSAEAQRRARIELGQPDTQGEKYRVAIGLRPLDEIGGDLRYGFRSIYRHPWISIAAVASLALGVAATSAMFSVIYATLLHPFHYSDADRIVNPSLVNEKQPLVPTWFALDPDQYESFSKAKSIDDVLGFMLASEPETGEEFPEDVNIAYVTSNMNEFLGIPASLGRGFRPSDDTQNVIVLSHKYFLRRFGGDQSVIGRTVDLGHQNFRIIGVMPPRFTFTETVGNVDGYIPWNASRSKALFPWIKLKFGITPAAADAEFQSYLNTFQQETPLHFPKEFRVDVQTIAAPYIHRTGRTLALLFVSVVVLLLIACANCSVLFLARGQAREHELSIRSAIGAGRFRLIRQLLVEALAIAFVGAALGTALSFWLAQLPLHLVPNMFPQEAVIRINWAVLGFSVALALLTGTLSGLAPAFHFSRPDVSYMMQRRARTLSGAGRKSLSALIGLQVALSLVLLGIAGAAIGGFIHISSMNLGYDPHDAGFLRIPLQHDPTRNRQAYARYIESLRDTVATVPGVISVGISSSGIPPSQPFGGFGQEPSFELLGHKADAQQHALVQLVSTDYFATLKIPLFSGRLWTPDENLRGDFVAIVNEKFAQLYLAGQQAIGQQLRTDALKNDGAPLSITSPDSGGWRQIIGVVANYRNDGLERPVAPAVYVPYTTFMWDSTQLFIRTAGEPERIKQPLLAGIHAFNPSQRIYANEICTLEGALHLQPIWVQQHMFSVLFGCFGGLALLLSLFGIASTVFFATAQRRKEIGIRMALGAGPVHVVWTVSGGTLATVASGIAGGVILDLSLQRVVNHWMPGNDYTPWIFVTVTALLLAGSAVACFLPAAGAAHADPMDSLRTD